MDNKNKQFLDILKWFAIGGAIGVFIFLITIVFSMLF